MQYLVYDIGGSSIKWAVLKADLTMVKSGKIMRQPTFEKMIEKMIEVYSENKHISGISIACPGSVDPQSGIIYGASALDYIHGPNFKEIFKVKTGFDIAIENDGNCAALSETYYGEEDLNDLCYVVLGSGIGGAIVKNKKIHHGNNLHGGEFGYQIIDQELNSWSEIGSTVNLVKTVRVLLNDDSIDGIEVFKQKNKNEQIAKLVEDFYRVNAIGIFNLQYVYDPQIILLGGAIVDNDEAITGIKNQVNQILTKSVGKIKPEIKVGKFREHANIYGALANLLYIKED